MKVGVACGGTGGHVLPGVAVARMLEGRGHNVTLWLGGRSVEGLSAGEWHGEVERVRAAGFPSGVSLEALRAGARAVAAIAQCSVRMARRRPGVLLAMGSYSSLGPVLAARLRRVPVVLHEANAVPGRAISFLSRFANAVAVGFPGASAGMRCARIVHTGMPIREDLGGLAHKPLLEGEGFTVLVMGGSLGAHRLNEVVPEALCACFRRYPDLRVIHLAGQADEASVRGQYGRAGLPHHVCAFMKEMGRAYASASLAICRAGASTCMELAACRVPALLIPLPTAVRDHQTANARALEAAGGADVAAERDLSSEWLVRYVESRRSDSARLDRMRKAMESVRMPDATRRVADLVESVGRDAGRRPG